MIPGVLWYITHSHKLYVQKSMLDSIYEAKIYTQQSEAKADKNGKRN